MSKDKFLKYEKAYVSDCFCHCLANILMNSEMNIEPDIILCDNISLFYDMQTHDIGINYPLKNNAPIYIDSSYQKYIANSYGMITFHPVQYADNGKEYANDSRTDMIEIRRYISDDSQIAVNRIIHLLTDSKMIICAVDVYYLKYHKAHLKMHALHYIIITEINLKENWVKVIDEYHFTGSRYTGKIAFNDFIEARSSLNPYNESYEGISGVPIRNLWVEVQISPLFPANTDTILSIIRRSINSLGAICEKTFRCWGLKALKSLCEDLQNVENWDINHNFYFTHIFRSAIKNISKNRMRFSALLKLTEGRKDLAETIEYCEKSGEYWLKLSGVAYKYGVQRKPGTLANMVKILQDILLMEEKIHENLISYMEELTCRNVITK